MKILLIDDHALFRDGILLVLEGLSDDIETFEAGSYESATIILNQQHDFDLILLDLDLPGISFLEALKAIREQLPDSPIVVLSATENHLMVEQAFHHGARGYVPKSSSAKIMLSALQLVISGGTYVPPEVFREKINNTGKKLENDFNVDKKLTPRQCEVLIHLAKGKSNREIGNTLDLTESTIRAHVAAILKAFDVNNRTQAVQYATQKNWI